MDKGKLAMLATNNYGSIETIGPRQAAVLAFLLSVKQHAATVQTIGAFLDANVHGSVTALHARGLLFYYNPRYVRWASQKFNHAAKSHYKVCLTDAGAAVAKQISQLPTQPGFGFVVCNMPPIQNVLP